MPSFLGNFGLGDFSTTIFFGLGDFSTAAFFDIGNFLAAAFFDIGNFSATTFLVLTAVSFFLAAFFIAFGVMASCTSGASFTTLVGVNSVSAFFLSISLLLLLLGPFTIDSSERRASVVAPCNLANPSKAFAILTES